MKDSLESAFSLEVIVKKCLLFFPDRFQRFLDWTTDGTVLESKRNGDENEVEEEHCYTEGLIHFPPEASDAEYNEAQHTEKDEHRTGHTRTADLHRSSDDHAIE